MQAFILIPLAICFMSTPARYIMFQEKGGASAGDGTASQRSGFHPSHQSKDYMNLEEFESIARKKSNQLEGRERADTGSLMGPESMNDNQRETSMVLDTKKKVQFDSL